MFVYAQGDFFVGVILVLKSLKKISMEGAALKVAPDETLS